MMRRWAAAMLIVCLASGCGIGAAPATPTLPPTAIPPTPTPVPSATATATETPTVAPTATATASPTPSPAPTQTPTGTPAPTATATPAPLPTIFVPEVILRDVQRVEDGGFTFQSVYQYTVGFRPAQATLGSDVEPTLITLISAPVNPGKSQTDVLANVLANMGASVGGFHAGDPYPVAFAATKGLAADFMGQMFGSPVTGQVVVLTQSASRVFYAYGISPDGATGKQWASRGSKVFQAVLNSVTFFEPKASTGNCPLSTDATYGYTPNNAIKVGGGDFGGPPRERAYLDALLGPTGQKLAYSRAGSVPGGGVILDIYQMTYAGLAKPIGLYIDEYNFDTLSAPMGFTCSGPFPLTKP